MPDDLVPMYVAASRLAFGDDDFVHHYTIEEYVLEIISAKNYPTDDGQDYERMAQRNTWPELDRETNRIVQLKLDGKIKIYARRRDDASGELVETEDGLWRLNDWNIGIAPNVLPAHPIYRSYNQGLYGPSSAKWYDPHVSWSEVERLAGGESASEPLSDVPAPLIDPITLKRLRDEKLEELIKQHADERRAGGRNPNRNIGFNFVRDSWPEALGRHPTRERFEPLFTEITGKRERGDHGRKLPKEMAAK
jgi:hypothetical protein